LKKAVEDSEAELKSAENRGKKPAKPEKNIRQKAEEFAKNIKDPEERKKAVERLKKMSPADMEKMLAGAMDDEEGEIGKTAGLRRSLVRLAYTKPELRKHLLPLIGRE